jgi:hypothetical protein
MASICLKTDAHPVPSKVLILQIFTPIFLNSDSTSFIHLNPFQSNFSANRILPSSYLFWAVKRLVDYCNYPTVLKQKTMEKHKEYNLRYLLAK